MRRLLLLLILASLAAVGNAQSIDEYMHMRRANSVAEPTPVSSIDNVVGTRVFELSTTVKGSFKVNGKGALMVDRGDGNTTIVNCINVPDWLVGSEVKARLLVKVSRNEHTDELSVDLIGAAPEDQVASKTTPPPAKASSKKAQRFSRGVLPSRSATYRSGRTNDLPESSVAPIYAERFRKINPRLSAEDADAIAKLLIGYSMKYGVDARLIVAMVTTESHFDPYATSRHGAQGLGQLMPGTAQGLGVGNAYDIEQNLEAMVRMVRGLLDTYKNATGNDQTALELTIAAYNAGSGAVAKYGGIPPYTETQNYVRKVLTLFAGLTSGDRN